MMYFAFEHIQFLLFCKLAVEQLFLFGFSALLLYILYLHLPLVDFFSRNLFLLDNVFLIRHKFTGLNLYYLLKMAYYREGREMKYMYIIDMRDN